MLYDFSSLFLRMIVVVTKIHFKVWHIVGVPQILAFFFFEDNIPILFIILSP